MQLSHQQNVSALHFIGTSQPGYIIADGTFILKGVGHPLGGQSEDMIKAVSHGAVSLYYNNALKLETTTDGVHINDNTLSFEGNTANTFETSLVADDPTQDATISIPNKTANLSLVKYTDINLVPGATSVTLNLTGDDDVRHVQFRLDSITYSSGPTNPTMTVQTNTSISHYWDMNVIRFNHYNDTTGILDYTTTTDLLVWLSNYATMPTTVVYNFYKLDSGRWTCEMIGAQSRGSTGYTIIQQCATDIGATYSNIGKIVISSGSSYNITTLKGTIAEYY